MIDLWTLLVVNLFQGFWFAVIGLTFMFWIILTIGRVSQMTSINFLMIFLIAMAIGYSNPIVMILGTILLLTVHVLAIPRLVDS